MTTPTTETETTTETEQEREERERFEEVLREERWTEIDGF